MLGKLRASVVAAFLVPYLRIQTLREYFEARFPRWRLFLGSAVFFSIFLAPQPDLWRHQILFGSLAAAAAWCAFLWYRGLRVPAVVLMYFFWCQIRVFAIYPQFEDWTIQATAQSFAMLLCVTMFVGLPSRKQHEFFLGTLATITLCTSLWLVALRFFTPRPWAWLNNPSADASLLAILYPTLMFRSNWFGRLGSELMANRFWVLRLLALCAGAVLPLVAIGCCSSSTAVIAILIALAFSVWRDPDRKTMGSLLVFLGAIAIPLASIRFFTKDHFFNDNGRREVWLLMMQWWRQYIPEHWIGTGGGTYFYAGTSVQRAMGYPNGGLFGYMHNEYLQTIFEQGWIGAILLVLVGVWTLKKSFDRPWLFASLLTYGFVMTTQFPFRYFASALIGALLVREAYETRSA